jgi:hypothetical protein
MLPTFVAIAFIYDLPFEFSTLIQQALFIISLIPIGASFLGLVLWIRYLKNVDKDKNSGAKRIKETTEVSSTVSNYIIAYAVSVVSVSVVGGFKGVLLLIVLVTVFGIYAFSWNVMFFNPFLMLLGYRVYWVELEDGIGSSGYVIMRINGGPVRNLKGNEFTMTKMDNYFYYLHYDN